MRAGQEEYPVYISGASTAYGCGFVVWLCRVALSCRVVPCNTTRELDCHCEHVRDDSAAMSIVHGMGFRGPNVLENESQGV